MEQMSIYYAVFSVGLALGAAAVALSIWWNQEKKKKRFCKDCQWSSFFVDHNSYVCFLAKRDVHSFDVCSEWSKRRGTATIKNLKGK